MIGSCHFIIWAGLIQGPECAHELRLSWRRKGLLAYQTSDFLTLLALPLTPCALTHTLPVQNLDMKEWMELVKENVARLDAFPKFDTAYLEKTLSGGYVTIITYTLLGLLMCTELTRYVLPPLQQRYVVDPLLGSQVVISLDISVATPCDKLAVLQVEQAENTHILGDNALAMTDEYWDDGLP